MQNVINISTLDSLQRLFPGATSIGSRALAEVLGIPRKTISNFGDRFAIPSFRVGRHRLYRLLDVAHYIDKSLGLSAPSIGALSAQPSQPLGTSRRGPGRPRKMSVRQESAA